MCIHIVVAYILNHMSIKVQQSEVVFVRCSISLYTRTMVVQEVLRYGSEV
jgi:hypothetical protein